MSLSPSKTPKYIRSPLADYFSNFDPNETLSPQKTLSTTFPSPSSPLPVGQPSIETITLSSFSEDLSPSLLSPIRAAWPLYEMMSSPSSPFHFSPPSFSRHLEDHPGGEAPVLSHTLPFSPATTSGAPFEHAKLAQPGLSPSPISPVATVPRTPGWWVNPATLRSSCREGLQPVSPPVHSSSLPQTSVLPLTPGKWFGKRLEFE